MTEPNGAPSGADVPSASSSATQPASTGRPSRATIVRSLKSKNVEMPAVEAKPLDASEPQGDGTPRADEPAQKIEGDTANLDAGKGEQKPNEKQKDNESVPLPAFKERLAKEKGRREKLEADLTAARTNEAKVRAVLDAALTENERLTEQLRAGQPFDERGEELQSLKLRQQVTEQITAAEQKVQQDFEAARRDAQVSDLAAQLRNEVNDACAAFPLVSPADVRAALRANPDADVRQFAQAKHEERKTIIAKQGSAQADTSQLPATVAKPTGTSRFQAPLSRKGMAQAIRHAQAKN